MRGNLRCIDGQLMRHDPQPDDPDLETDVGKCPDCNGNGCDEDGTKNEMWDTYKLNRHQ